MRVIILKNYEQVSECVFNHFIASFKKNTRDNFVLGLPTGGTPILFYEKIAKNQVDFSKIITFNMDEYIGISRDNKNSFYSFMNENLYKKVNIKPENINIPNGEAMDLEQECKKYEEKIKLYGGIDLFVGGIGTNGHIAFNEPNSDFSSVTRVVNLTEKTIKDNARFFNSADDVPKTAITVGISTIMGAKELLFMANGKNKAEAIKQTVNGAADKLWPSSFLKNHKNVTLVIDEAAAILL